MKSRIPTYRTQNHQKYTSSRQFFWLVEHQTYRKSDLSMSNLLKYTCTCIWCVMLRLIEVHLYMYFVCHAPSRPWPQHCCCANTGRQAGRQALVGLSFLKPFGLTSWPLRTVCWWNVCKYVWVRQSAPTEVFTKRKDVQAWLVKPDTFKPESTINRTIFERRIPARRLKLHSYNPEYAINRTLFYSRPVMLFEPYIA